MATTLIPTITHRYTVRLTSILCLLTSPLEELLHKNPMNSSSKEEIEKFFTELKADKIITSFTIGEEKMNSHFLIEYEFMYDGNKPTTHEVFCRRDYIKDFIDYTDTDYPSSLGGTCNDYEP